MEREENNGDSDQQGDGHLNDDRDFDNYRNEGLQDSEQSEPEKTEVVEKSAGGEQHQTKQKPL